MIALSTMEFWIFAMGWVVSVLFLFLIVLFIKFTPAKVFLKAWLTRSAVSWVKFRTGLGEFRNSKSTDPGSIDVKNLGFVQLVEGSQVLERNSKCPVYDVFGEYGTSIPKEYPAIIQELRDAGYVVNSFRDYSHLVRLTSDEVYASEYVDSLKGDKKKEAIQQIKYLKALEIKIKPYKTYKVHELAFMFPNNISPVYVDAKVTNAVSRIRNKEKFQQQMLIYGSFAVLVLLIGLVIFMKLIKAPNCPSVECKCAQAGLDIARATVNGSLGI